MFVGFGRGSGGHKSGPGLAAAGNRLRLGIRGSSARRCLRGNQWAKLGVP
jgi:hypothetical protein